MFSGSEYKIGRIAAQPAEKRKEIRMNMVEYGCESRFYRILLFSGMLFLVNVVVICDAHSAPWTRRVVDDSSSGADGVRVEDANGDGLVDVVTGWEEGGLVRLYLHPGVDDVREPWPNVTVGRVDAVEDAVFADVDGDGAADVISACEGANRTVFVHWAPSEPDDYVHEDEWSTAPIPASAGKMQWMFSVPVFDNEQRFIGVVCGAKGAGAAIGWLVPPPDPRKLDQWSWKPLAPASWIMSIRVFPNSRRPLPDIAYTERRGTQPGAYLLRHTGAHTDAWSAQRIYLGGVSAEVMFAHFELDQNYGRVVAALKSKSVITMNGAWEDVPWKPEHIAIPDTAGLGKAVAVGNLDDDPESEWVVSCEHAENKDGVLLYDSDGRNRTVSSISGKAGTKFDRLELVDLDGDGDLDVLTTEEKEGLGVIWYENPWKQ